MLVELSAQSYVKYLMELEGGGSEILTAVLTLPCSWLTRNFVKFYLDPSKLLFISPDYYNLVHFINYVFHVVWNL